MASVLVVDDDVQLRDALTRDLRTRGYEVSSAGTYSEAMERLRGEEFDVLLTDLRLTDRDGMELITDLPAAAPATRPILMSAFATAKDSQRATELGVVRVLCKPFGTDELVQAVEQAVECSTGFRGSVHGLSLVDILQMFHYGKRSMTLTLAGPVPARIHMRHGEVVHAARGDTVGEPALRSILRMPSGTLKTNALESEEISIERAFQSLLLDMLRDLDEQNKKGAGPSALDSLFSGDFASIFPAALPVVPAHGPSPIDAACMKVVSSVEGGVACGVVDLDAGILLGLHTVAGSSRELHEAVVTVAVDLFRGPHVGRIEQMVRAHRSVAENGAHYFDEVQISSKNNLHFVKALRGGRAVIMLITEKSTNLGMGWLQLKSVIPSVEPLVP
jgi:CheY-like chemotaxis protein